MTKPMLSCGILAPCVARHPSDSKSNVGRAARILGSKGLGAFREQYEVGYSGRSKLRRFYLCRHRATRNFLCISLRLARSDQNTLGRQFFRKARLFDRQAHLGQHRLDALQNGPGSVKCGCLHDSNVATGGKQLPDHFRANGLPQQRTPRDGPRASALNTQFSALDWQRLNIFMPISERYMRRGHMRHRHDGQLQNKHRATRCELPVLVGWR